MLLVQSLREVCGVLDCIIQQLSLLNLFKTECTFPVHLIWILVFPSALDTKASNLSALSKKYRSDAKYLNTRSTYAKVAAVAVFFITLVVYVRFWWLWSALETRSLTEGRSLRSRVPERLILYIPSLLKEVLWCLLFKLSHRSVVGLKAKASWIHGPVYYNIERRVFKNDHSDTGIGVSYIVWASSRNVCILGGLNVIKECLLFKVYIATKSYWKY